MIRRKRPGRLNESVACPKLDWKSDNLDYELWIPGFYADATIGDIGICFTTWDLLDRFNAYFTFRDNYRISYFYSGRVDGLDGGRRLCEEVWNSICEESQYRDLSKRDITEIAEKLGWKSKNH